MRLYDQNTLTCQSANTNNIPREPIHGPVTSAHVTFYVLVFPPFFNLTTPSPLYMLLPIGMLLEQNAISSLPLSLFG